MMIALASQFHVYIQEKALVGAFSVIVKLHLIFGNLGLKLYQGPAAGVLGPGGQEAGDPGLGTQRHLPALLQVSRTTIVGESAYFHSKAPLFREMSLVVDTSEDCDNTFL